MEPKEELRRAMRQLRWSTTRLAQVVYVAQHEDDDPDEIAKFAARVKKEFQRQTTSAERFAGYLMILQAHPQYASLGRVVPSFCPSDALDPRIARGVQEISERLSEGLLDEEKWRDIED